VLFSNIPDNRIMRLDEDDDHVSVFRQWSMNSNGNTIDREGRLINCEHSGWWITRTKRDDSITIIADSQNSKKLNLPNNDVVASDGSIWFTDLAYLWHRRFWRASTKRGWPRMCGRPSGLKRGVRPDESR